MLAVLHTSKPPAVYRLQTRAQFQAVLAGTTVAKTAHFALHRCAVVVCSELQQPVLFPHSGMWLGAMVPKRWAKRAVTRNMIKRQIYQLGSDHAPLFLPQAHLVRLRKGFDRKDFVSASSLVLKAEVRKELRILVQRMAEAALQAKVAPA